MIPADNNATVSEEVRELYGNLSKHLAHSKCDCVTVEECYTKRLGLLSDALRKEGGRVLEGVTADFFLQHETKYTQRWDHVEEHDDCYTWECSCGAIEESKFHTWEECHMQTRRHWAEAIRALAAKGASHE
jgi:hypothetical protein